MNKKEELISIVVPVYKVEKYLNKCIESILNQTYKNLEIILVDDGSPDRCGEICDEYAKKDDRVKVVHQENRGVSACRNLGIDISNGDFVGFIDSDDYIAENMYQQLYETIKKDGTDMAICDFLYVDEAEIPVTAMNEKSPIRSEVLSCWQMLKKLVEPMHWYYILPWNKLYKKEILTKNRFPEGKRYEDEVIAHWIMGECDNVSCIKEKLYFYRQQKGSFMNREYDAKNLEAVEAFFDRTEFFLERNMFEEAIRAYDMGIGFLRFGYRKLKRNEKSVNDILKSLKMKSDVLYKKIVRHRLSARDFIVFSLFFLQPVLCNFVLDSIRRLKRDNKGERER